MMTTMTPLFCLTIVSISEIPVQWERYRVELAVEALDAQSANMIFQRLIEGSTSTENPLVMRTFVHVTNPKVFKQCLEWKEKQIRAKWNEYFSMEPAVP